jgi:hypothetical protein
MFLEQRHKFILKGHLPMMLLLIADVIFYRVPVGGAHAQCRKALLPAKLRFVSRTHLDEFALIVSIAFASGNVAGR